MKKLVLCLALVSLLMLALGAAAGAEPPTLRSRATTVSDTYARSVALAGAPAAHQTGSTVIAIAPASAANDIDTSVTITGAGYSVAAPPTASLGTTALTGVTVVDATTLSATVPWGMDSGVYTLTVVDPGGASSSLANAFTVTAGIGQWNGGDLCGGGVSEMQLKPGDPTTVYALAGGVGLFRSRDAGENWSFIGSPKDVVEPADFTIDPLHPAWLYTYAYGDTEHSGLFRSQDEGDTWTRLMGITWPDGRSLARGQVYPSPYDPQVLFVGSYSLPGDPTDDRALGLVKSTDGGATWGIVADMEGISVQDVAFHPTDPLQMVLATGAGQVFRSSDAGDSWNEVLKPPLSTIEPHVPVIGSITYNPYRPTEVWVTADADGRLFKSTDFTSWQDMTPPNADPSKMCFCTFSSADTVYAERFRSVDGGLNWDWFGPSTSFNTCEITFDPTDPQIGYVGDEAFGVQKTTDGGQTWALKNQGLTGVRLITMEVSPTDPLRVFATAGPNGFYRSDDGAGSWRHIAIDGSYNVRLVREDPFDPQRLYVAADSGFYVSEDGGGSWSALGWNTDAPLPSQWVFSFAMEPDPYQAGHLLVGLTTAPFATLGRLYASDDYGKSWTSKSMTGLPADLATITTVVFHPETQGLVYVTTTGTGIYRSTDSGGSWERIDDLQQPMQSVTGITIATHPQPMLFVGTDTVPYRSLDGGATWETPQNAQSGVTAYTFVDGDSTRLYDATWFGLRFSRDAGDTWQWAAGVLGGLHVTALGYATASDYTILYAATLGGDPGATGSAAVAAPRKAPAAASTLVDPGIYRYVQVAAPTLSGFAPTSGPVGTIVTVSGSDLTHVTAVTFNGAAATSFTVLSATQLTATVPAGVGTGPLAVTTPGGSATSSGSFTVTPRITLSAPTVASSWPSGSTQTVAWTLSHAVSNGQFCVWLVSSGGTWYVGKQVIASAGLTSYSTAIAVSVPVAAGNRAYVYWRPTVGSGAWLATAQSAAFAVTAPIPKITLSAPTVASSWPSGSTQTVSWTLSQAVSNGQFCVWLVSPGGTWYVGKQVLPSAGLRSYSTAITASVPAAVGYKAYVYWRPSVGIGDWMATAQSGAFTVTPLNITSPTAASVWPFGSTQTVSWTINPAVSTGEFRVWLVSAGGTWYVGKQVLPSAGLRSYSTAITASVPTASGYKAYVYWRPSVGNGDWMATAQSAAFRVTAPTITVTSPASGSVWPAGSSKTVAWTISPAVATGEFRVWLVSAGGTWYVGKQVLPGTGLTSYSTAITASVPTASGYKAYVYWRPVIGNGDWMATAQSGAFTVTP